MRLHRLDLTDFRGTTHRSVEFSGGVTVVEGANEAGKSSLMEALRFLRVHKASSRKAEIKAVQPVGRDVGPAVFVELSTGPYRLTYAKRWLKSPKTELHISEPRPEQLVGDQAHERFLDIIAETSDEGLFEALEIIQGQSLGQPELAVLPPLRRALDLAAEDPTGSDQLMALVENEYSRYFTATGKPTGEYLRGSREIEQLQARFQELTDASATIDALTERVRDTTQAAEGIARQAAQAQQAVAELEQQEAELNRLRQKHSEAMHHVVLAEAEQSAAHLAYAQRQLAIEDAQRLSAEAEQAQHTMAALRERLDDADRSLQLAHHDLTKTITSHEQARGHSAELMQRLDRVRQLQERTSLQQLLDQLAASETELAEAERILSGVVLEPTELEQLEELEVQRRLAAARWQASAAAITLEVSGEVSLNQSALRPGHHGPLPVTEPTQVSVPGQLQLRIDPGEGTAQGNQEANDAVLALGEALAAHGLGSLEQARLVADRTAKAKSARDTARHRIAQLLAGRTTAALQARLAVLAQVVEEGDPDDIAQLVDQAREIVSQRDQEVRECQQRLDAARAAQNLAQESWIRSEAETKSLLSQAEQAELKLREARQELDDDQLEDRVNQAATSLEQARSQGEDIRSQLEAADADTHTLLLENQRQVAARLAAEHTELRDELTRCRALLADRLASGVYDRLMDARVQRDQAETAQAARHRSAQAIKRLRETLIQHRLAAERRYVGPFREQIERLAKLVYGPEVHLEVGPDLRLRSRTLHGVTVPFESLSTGTREQLSLLGRLACAQLVQPGQGVPVVIDDALGFADPQRLARLGAVLNKVAASAQIIILTSQPERYSQIGGATQVRLT